MYTPLYTALLDLYNKNQLSFHMPGHSGEKGMEGFSLLCEIDTTEVPESDNLFFADGPIAEAERAAAEFFGAKKTRLLVGGSSSGVLAMVGAAVREGEKIICDRFCHRSFVSALVFSGAVPVWITPESLEGGALWGGIAPADVERALRENPDAKAVYITSPNYFGYASDVSAIAEIAHKYGAALLVDGAHGAHFGLSPLLPPAPWKCGADLCTVSAHKTLPALTQAAWLHINMDFPRLEAMLKMHQSSSPSYILMASLDYARAKMEEEGERLWSGLAENSLAVFPEQGNVPGKYVKYKDPTRLVLPTGGNPFKAAERLRKEHGISVECSYGKGVVCITNISHTAEDLRRLKAALCTAENSPSPVPGFTTEMHYAAMAPRRAFYADIEEVELSEAAGRVCAREVLLYPPGVPRVLPGEVVTEADIAAISALISAGGEVHGVENGRICCVLM